MYLKELQLYGFKSFAQKTVLKFDPPATQGVTAVVGPNGSGKSNIADAVRWVLGGQSSKSIRTKRIEDVVFFGSEKKSKSSFAEITLVLDNADKKMPLDYEEVAVTRRYYRSGESEYLVNGSKVRLTDLEQLFLAAGFGTSTYAVIGQGQVDAALSASPVERKVIFDEAAGVKQHELRRGEALRKLAATEENMTRLRDILAELEPRLKLLRREAKRMEEGKEVADKLRALEEQYYRFQFNKLNTELERHREEEADRRKTIEALAKEIAALTETASEAEQRDAKKRQELSDMRQKLEGAVREQFAIKENLITVSGRLEAAREKSGGVTAANLLKEIDRLKKELGHTAARAKETEKQLVVGRKEIAQLQDALAAVEDGMNEAESALRLLTEQGLDVHREAFDNLIAEQKALVIALGKTNDAAELKALAQKAASILDALEELSAVLFAQKEHPRAAALKATLLETMSKKQKLAEALAHRRSETALLERTAVMLNDLQKEHEHSIEALSERVVAEKSSAKKEGVIRELAKELEQLSRALEQKEEDVGSMREAIGRLEEDLETTRGAGYKTRETAREKELLKTKLNDDLHRLEVDTARIETRSSTLSETIVERLGVPFLEALKDGGGPAAELEHPEAVYGEIEKLRSRVAQLGGIDESVTAEYGEVEERFTFLSDQLSDIEKASVDLKKTISDLDGLITTRFREAFKEIALEFERYFSTLFGGGTARLVLVESEAGMGIEIVATPPGKRVQHLHTLSGGERTLTSLALLSAILTVNPSPFVVLDEVDAALDEPNTQRFLTIIKELAKDTQFILITHNRETMKAATIIYGITMGDDHASKLLSIRLEEAQEIAE